MNYKLKYLLVFISLILVCAVAGVGYSIKLTSQDFPRAEETQRANVTKYQERFLADQEKLSADPLFAFSGKAADAGPFLNPLVVWSGGERGDMQRFFPKPSSLVLAEDIKSALHNENWLEAKVDVSKLDTSWMSQLATFDHWNVLDSGPLDQLYKANPAQNFWSLPIPDYLNLQFWAKIRLLQGFQARKPLVALQEVRQLARLIYSNQFLVSEMVYLAILDAEKATYALAVEKRVITPESWMPITKENSVRAHRALWGFSGMIDIWTDEKILEHILDGKTAKAGMCSAIQEKISSMTLSREFYEGDLYFAKDFAPRFQKLDKLIDNAQSHCTISEHLLHLWKNPGLTAQWLSAEGFAMGHVGLAEKLKWTFLLHVPILRSWLGAQLDNIARPNYFHGSYQKWLLEGEKKIED